MTKYVVKIGNKYLTAYGTRTADICCAEKFKDPDEALEALEFVDWDLQGEEPEVVEVEE